MNTTLAYLVARLHAAKNEDEGASILEWVLILGGVFVAGTAIVLVVTGKLETLANGLFGGGGGGGTKPVPNP